MGPSHGPTTPHATAKSCRSMSLKEIRAVPRRSHVAMDREIATMMMSSAQTTFSVCQTVVEVTTKKLSAVGQVRHYRGSLP